jgi:hypothetical protein
MTQNGVTVQTAISNIATLAGAVNTFSAGATGLTPNTPATGNVVLGGVLNASSGGTGTTNPVGYLFGNGSSPATASATIPTTSLSGKITNAQLTYDYLTVNGTQATLGTAITLPEGVVYTATAGANFTTAPAPVGITSNGQLFPIVSGWTLQANGSMTGNEYNTINIGVDNLDNSIIGVAIGTNNTLYGLQQTRGTLNFPTRITIDTNVTQNILSSTSTGSNNFVIAYAKSDGIYISNLRIVTGALTPATARMVTDTPLAGTAIRIRGQAIGNYWYGIICYINQSSQTIVQPVWLNLGTPQIGGSAITLPTSAVVNLDATAIGSSSSLAFLVSTTTALYQVNYNSTTQAITPTTTFNLTTLFGAGYTVQHMCQLGTSFNVAVFTLVDSNNNTYLESAVWNGAAALTTENNKIGVFNNASQIVEIRSNRTTNQFALIVNNTNVGAIQGYTYVTSTIALSATYSVNPVSIAGVGIIWSDSTSSDYNGDLILAYVTGTLSSSPVTAALQLTGGTQSVYAGWIKTPVTLGSTATVYGIGNLVEGLSGLTPGVMYYVDTNGTLTTSNVGSVVGQAVNSTSLALGQNPNQGTGGGGGGGGSGTVTSVAVQSANGFNGSVAFPTSAAVISLGTTVTGLLYGNGTIAAAATGAQVVAAIGSTPISGGTF